MFPCLCALEIFVAEHFLCLSNKTVSEFFQKHFVAATNVSCMSKQANFVAEKFYAMFPHLWGPLLADFF